jgi:hypothetical protein
MQIQFPRRVRLGFRPWYGLTLRQLGYLVVTGVAAGAIVLFGPVEGSGLLVRVVIGLAIISLGVALAFFSKDGLTAERWIAVQLKFLTRPQKRVWTRSDGDRSATRDQIAEIAIDRPQGEDSGANETELGDLDAAGFSRGGLLRPTARSSDVPSAVVVLIDMAMLLSLLALVVYLLRGGLGEIQGWFLLELRR